MEATSTSYKLIKSVKSSKFNIDELHYYNLSLQIGVRDFQVNIIDTRNGNCLLLEDYILAKIRSNSGLVGVLSDIVDNHHVLSAGFWKSVKIIIKNTKFSLVPSSMFVKEAVEDYLRINTEFDEITEEALYYKNIRSSAVSVFAVSKELLAWARSQYEKAELGILHQSAALIEGVMNEKEQYPKNSMYLYIDRFKLHILSIKGKDLQYYNQFTIKQFKDYIKYIMLVIKGLNFSQTSTNVVLWGYIGKKSSHYDEFYKYIKNISFGNRPDFLNFDYMFDEIQDHHFFDLYSSYLCE
ncbi:MAG: DUF3822 family protein [Cyclobacteriaceae bacterium]|nr:DUF3822 family protein [Cyclobacteriaceae bacterium]